jgi:hypothetical protein
MGNRVAKKRKKEEDLFIKNIIRKDHPPMSSHDTPRMESHQACAAAHALIITQTSDLLLQACGLSPELRPDQFIQTQQSEPISRGRGRPQQVCWTQLWSSLLLCALQGMHSFADWRRLLGLQQIGPFAPVWLTRNGLVKRLLRSGLEPFQELWERINAQLTQSDSQAVPAALVAFASDILCLDETRLDALGKYLKPLRGLSSSDAASFAGKLIGLFDLRAQRWLRLEWREAVHENCRVDILDFLQGLSVDSLLLFDLGYFSDLASLIL